MHVSCINKAVYTTTRMCLYHPATRMWLYPKPRVLDTATRLMTAQSKGCTAMLLGQYTLSIADGIKLSPY